MKVGIVIPIYDHPASIQTVVEGAHKHGLPIVVVDDGSGAPTRAVLDRLAARVPGLEVLRHARNRGKGAALRTGFRRAAALGLTHVVHLDADGQHDPADLPRFLEALRERPEAAVLGRPVFDESVPRVRLLARQLSRGLVWLATASRRIDDPLCGYRALPLGATLGILDRVRTGSRMEFEPEIAVRLVWAGVPVRNLPVRVVYPPDGVSHFGFWREYPRLAGLYLRLVAGMPRRIGALRRGADA